MTKRAPYIPFYPSDWLAGVADLSPAECGIYVNLLMLIYDAGGPVRADFGRLSRRLNCPVSTLRSIVIALCASKKMIMDGGFIMNERAELELSKRAEKSQKARQSVNVREEKKQKYGGKNPISSASSDQGTSQDLPIKTSTDEHRTINERSSNQNQNQNIPPIPPTGKGVNASEVKAIWDMASPLGKKRSGISKTKVELQKLVRSGIDLQTIELAIRAYYVDCDKTGLGHMGLHLFIRDRCASWIEVMDREKPKDVAVDRVATARALLAERRVEGRWREQWTVDTGMTEQDAERLAA